MNQLPRVGSFKEDSGPSAVGETHLSTGGHEINMTYSHILPPFLGRKIRSFQGGFFQTSELYASESCPPLLVQKRPKKNLEKIMVKKMLTASSPISLRRKLS